MIDLYAILGARKNSKVEALKKAYRKAALRTHPDRGGNQEDFEQVNLAWTVLGDPMRRAHYDATGEYDTGSRDIGRAKITGILVNCLSVVVQALVEQGADPKTQNVLSLMQKVLGQARGNLETSLTKLEEALKCCEEVHSRLKTTEETRLMPSIVGGSISKMKIDLAEGQVAISYYNLAKDVLDKCAYEVEKVPSFMGQDVAAWGMQWTFSTKG